jgi:hypothetical protein
MLRYVPGFGNTRPSKGSRAPNFNERLAEGNFHVSGILETSKCEVRHEA